MMTQGQSRPIPGAGGLAAKPSAARGPRATPAVRERRAPPWLAAALVLASAVSPAALAGEGADPARELLQLGREAYAKRDFKAAAQRFQDFLQRFAAHGQASQACYGLGLSLIQSGERDFAKIAPLLEQALDDPKLPDRPGALSWCGAAYRERARKASGASDLLTLLGLAAARFGEAAEACAALARNIPDAASGELPPAVEAEIRCRCDQAEALLDAGRAREALEALAGAAGDRRLARSRWRDRVHYVLGCASCVSGDAVSAARALVRLAPFEQPVSGPHARFLLARIHHAAGETTEALEHYEAVPASYDRHVQAARQAIQSNAESVRDHPPERARLEALVAGPPPDWASDALFHAGTILHEQGKFEEALGRFVRLGQRQPAPPRAEEAALFAGICQAQLGRHAEAVRALQPLLAHPRFGAQARTWTARSLVRGADPAQPQALQQALVQAVEHLRQAAAQLAGRPGSAGDADDVLLELAGLLRRAGRPADAAPLYRQLAGGGRAEEARAGLVACLQLAGQPREAEEAFRQLEKEHPRSPLLAEALVHYAECSFAAARAAGDAPANRPLYEETARRCERVVSKYPDLPQASLCRCRLAAARHALGQYAEAAAVLAAIPEPDRGGALAAASYLLADALLRSGPAADEAQDALAAATRLQQLQQAIQALQAFLAAPAGAPLAPDAMMKLGYCHQQVAALLTVPADRAASANAAREVYERVRTQFPDHPLRPVAEVERANSIALAGELPLAIEKLTRFGADPFAKAPIAPLALARQAQLMLAAGRAADAAGVLAQCLARYEGELGKDPARAAWVPLLRYHHGLALRGAGQAAEAVKVFEGIVRDFPGSPWAGASRDRLGEKKP
jgi:cellulose synthase operon protein C